MNEAHFPDRQLQPVSRPVATPVRTASSTLAAKKPTLEDQAIDMWQHGNETWTSSRLVIDKKSSQVLMNRTGTWAIAPHLNDVNMPTGAYTIYKRQDMGSVGATWVKAARMESMGSEVHIGQAYLPIKDLAAYEARPEWRPRQGRFTVRIDDSQSIGMGSANVFRVSMLADRAQAAGAKPGMLKVAKGDDTILRHGVAASLKITMRNPDAHISRVILSGTDAAIPGIKGAEHRYYVVDAREDGATLDEICRSGDIGGIPVSSNNTRQQAMLITAIIDAVDSLNQVRGPDGTHSRAPAGEQIVCSDLKPDNFIVRLQHQRGVDDLPIKAVLIDKDAMYDQARSSEVRAEQAQAGARFVADFAGPDPWAYPGAQADDPCFKPDRVDAYHGHQIAKIALARWDAHRPDDADTTARAMKRAKVMGHDPASMSETTKLAFYTQEKLSVGYNTRWIQTIRAKESPTAGSPDDRMLRALERALSETPPPLAEFRREMAALSV
jgi:hypothetical protein